MTPINEWNVLVVEDEADSMELVQGLLNYHGIQSVGVSDGEAALQVLATTHPTLILVDLALPGLDGWGLLKRIRHGAQTAAIPCVAMTAYHSPELADKAIVAGFNAYFSKPIDATSFVRELESIVAN